MRKLAFVLCCLFFSGLFAVPQAAAQAENTPGLLTGIPDTNAYSAYLAQYQNAARPGETVTAELDRQTTPLSEYGGTSGLLIGEGKTVQIHITVPQAGLYPVQMSYIACEGSGFQVEASLTLNGNTPFEGAGNLVLTKIYVDSEPIRRDRMNNDIRPAQKEVAEEQTAYIHDALGYEADPWLFYFEAGENTVALYIGRGGILLTSLELVQQKPVPSYEEYIASLHGETDTSGKTIRIEAETPQSKSYPTLYADSDKTSAAVWPNPQGKYRLNVFGGSNFNRAGQWVQYEFTAEEAGFYCLNLKYKQNFSNGTASCRQILIDGSPLFDGMNAISFDYKTRFQNKILGDETPQKIYLSEGRHTIKICMVLGEYGAIASAMEESVRRLNDAYRQSIMYLGTSPDANRDYDVENNLAGVLDIFSAEAAVMRQISGEILRVNGAKNEKTALLDRFAYQLEDFIKKPEDYPKRLSNFSTNISSMSAQTSDLSIQPLALDYILFYSPDATVPKAEANFFANVWNEAVNFGVSFMEDYNAFGAEGETSIDVWITSGRDQANVLRRMIEDVFTPQYNVGVRSRLVQPSMVLPAVVAGIGPDAVLQMGNGEPVNYAIRGAMYDLSVFDDCEEVKTRFTPTSLAPLGFAGGLYGLPETESFTMLFYRKDILTALELEVPETWKEATTVITQLAKNHFMFGLPQNNNMGLLGMFLYQNGGKFYQTDSYYSALNSEEGIGAFIQLTDLYKNYKLSLTYDILTRFRTGEMPMAITDYSFYNTLQVAAPEIRSLWDFAPVPGVQQEDGSIDRSVISSGLACMMLANTDHPQEAWSFLKWWVSAETQTRYGQDMEMFLGPSGRVSTANLEAMQQLSWTVRQTELINEQWQWVKAPENVPGGYFTGRHIDNAFRAVVISKEDPRETMKNYVRVINKEIESKCEELKIPVER